jgi:hypothetical protein
MRRLYDVVCVAAFLTWGLALRWQHHQRRCFWCGQPVINL